MSADDPTSVIPADASEQAASAPRARGRWRSVVGGIAWLGLAALVAATIGGFFSRSWWIFELMCHFRVQYFWLLTACAAIFLLARRYRGAMVAGAFLATNAALIAPLYLPPAAAPAGPPQLRVLSLNLFFRNRQYDEVLQLVREVKPDVLVLVEAEGRWIRELESLETQDHYFRTGPWGEICVYTLLQPRAPRFTRPLLRDCAVSVRLDVGGHDLTLIAAHPTSPQARKLVEERNLQYEQLTDLVKGQEGAVVLVGDLNSTSWSGAFSDLLAETGLQDSRQGFGVQASWPAFMPPLLVPIDHCLASPQVRIHDRRIGPAVGSDHYPLIVDLSVAGEK